MLRKLLVSMMAVSVISWPVQAQVAVSEPLLLGTAIDVNELDADQFSTLMEAFGTTDVSASIDGDPVAILAPTNAAWDALPTGSVTALLSAGENGELRRILACHTVEDETFLPAIKSIATNQSGTFSFDTVGGCRLTAAWEAGRIAITDDFGEMGFVAASDALSAETIIPINSVFAQGTITADGTVLPSRLFAGPTQFPPTDFAAYGIVAFPARSSELNGQDRHLMFCEAYVQTLPHVSELASPRAEQMVTVWPIEDDGQAAEINRIGRDEVCNRAVSSYGLLVAQEAIEHARASGKGLTGRGPFLLAWSPPQTKGGKDAIVLVADLSETTTSEQALEVMAQWRRDIVQNPELWKGGWSVDVLRLQLRNWADKYGPNLLSAFGLGG